MIVPEQIPGPFDSRKTPPLRIRFAGVPILSACMILQTAGNADGRDYPTKPVRILTSTAGGATDFAARMIGQGLSASLGQPIIVDNRAAIVSNETVSRATPDGYTLLVAGGALWINPLLERVPYDALNDFAPITFTGRSPGILLVHPAVAVKSVKELIALARSKPGVLNFGTGATGGPPHLAGVLFKSMAGVNIVRVPYKGGAPALVGLMSNEVQMMFATAGSVPPQLVKSEKFKVLAVTSLQPSELFPDLPTLSASGLPGFEVVSLDVVLAPSNTPAAIINRLQREIARDISKPETRQKFFNAGVEVLGTLPQESAQYIKSDVAKWSEVLGNADKRDGRPIGPPRTERSPPEILARLERSR